MKTISIILLTIYCHLIYGQTLPVKVWQTTQYAESINLKSPIIATDHLHNTYMVAIESFVNPFAGYILVKYDSLGNKLWEKTYPPTVAGNNFYGSFSLDGNGDSYISVNFKGDLPFFDADAVMVKYAQNGEELWSVSDFGIGNTGDNYIYCSGVDSIDHLIVLGMNLDDQNPGQNFLFVTSIDPTNGDILWKKTVPGEFRPKNIRLFQDRIEILATELKQGGAYYYIAQLSFSGDILSQYWKPFSGYDIDFNFITKSGDILLGNRAFGYAVTRIDIQGDTIWHYQYPSSNTNNQNWVRGVVEDDSNNVYATGGVKLSNLSLELLTTKFDETGAVVWQDTFHSTTDSLSDTGNSLSFSPNHIVVSGYTEVNTTDAEGIMVVNNSVNGLRDYSISIRNSDLNSISTSQAYLINDKLFFTGTGVQEMPGQAGAHVITGCYKIPKAITNTPILRTDNDIRIFPNPTRSHVHIKNIDLSLFDRYEINDINGRIIEGSRIALSEIIIDLSALNSGTYFLKIVGAELTFTKKLLVGN